LKNIPNIKFNSLDDKTDFELLDLSELFARLHLIDSHNPTLPHRVSFFALLIVTKGIGKHYIDLKEYNLTEGTILKIAKGQVHAFENKPEYEGYLILFTEEFVMNYFSKSSITIISHLYNYHIYSSKSTAKKTNEAFLNELKKELDIEDPYAQHNIIGGILNLYLLKLERTSKNDRIGKGKSKNYDVFIQFKNLVELKYKETRNVKDFANYMHTSTKTLNKIIKEFTINTAKNFIDNYVMLEAKREIISTNLSIKEISYYLGFDEVTNFTKFFKKQSGITPKQFKHQQGLGSHIYHS
jgi:AraC-like DNA-binding protein